jgi:small nuclear ribonucleoprotein (snRNP)-like protein
MDTRWAALFDDLEGEFEAARAMELDAEVRDRARREVARLALADRLTTAIGHPLTVRVHGAGTVRGTLTDAAPEWLLLTEAAADSLVPAHAVLHLAGLSGLSEEPTRTVKRLTLTYALRGLARRRTGVTVTLTDGSTLSGTLDRVGADFVELAEHAPGEPRRPKDVTTTRTVPLHALGLVRSA